MSDTLDIRRSRSKTASTRRDFGAGLREARERRGISLREIASTTKISSGALEALERNDVARLPGGIFTRGFVRSYAAEVGLDPEQTLREFLDGFPLEGVADGSLYASDTHEQETFESQRQMAGTLVRLVALSIPLAGLIVYFGMNGGSAGRDEVDSGEAVVSGTSDDSVRLTDVEEPQSDATTADPAVAGMLTIGIHPDAPCWVSLTVDGELVFSRLMQPGEREVFEAREGIVLSVGDAGAFAFTLNQQPGRRLGQSGEVVTARINHDNIGNYVVR